MRKITPDQSPLSPQSHNSIFRLVVRNFYTEADQVGWNRCGTLGATYLFLLFQCRIVELHLSPSIQQNRQLGRDTFQWRTAVSEHASHCLSHEQTEIRAILLIVFLPSSIQWETTYLPEPSNLLATSVVVPINGVPLPVIHIDFLHAA